MTRSCSFGYTCKAPAWQHHSTCQNLVWGSRHGSGQRDATSATHGLQFPAVMEHETLYCGNEKHDQCRLCAGQRWDADLVLA
eukprot:68423-Rhodomonas_salina.2